MDETEERTPDLAEGEDVSFEEERLRLEREALAVERERLAAARAHAEAAARLLQRRRRPALAFVGIFLLMTIAAVCGFLGGMAVVENRQNRKRADRLAEARSQIDPTVSTNALSESPVADQPDPAKPHQATVIKISSP